MRWRTHMAERQAIPLGSRIERLERVGDKYELWSRVDAWPVEPLDVSTAYSRYLEGYVHTKVELGDGGWSALAISPDAAAESATYLELDNYDRPFPVTERGLEAVRAADELQALPATDSKLADLASTIADAAAAEARSLRFALFRRLYAVFEKAPTQLPPAVFHLAPWELVDEAAEALVSAVDEGKTAPQPNLVHYFRDAAPGLTPALTALAASAPEGDAEEISALAAALLRVPPRRIPEGTRRRLSDLVDALERLPGAELRRHHLHELRRHLASGIAEARECEGRPTDPFTTVEIATGVGVDVGVLDGDAPPRVCWTEGDPAAEVLGRRLAAAVSEDEELASAVRALALAEVRFAAHPVKLWTLDSALAASSLFDALAGDSGGRQPDLLGQLLAERLPLAVEALVELGGLVHEPEAIEIVRSVESQLRQLREWMSPALAARLDTWLAVYVQWQFVWTELGRLEAVGTKGADPRSVPVSPDLVITGIVEDDAMLSLDAVPENRSVRLASVPLSTRVSDALRALRAAEEKPVLERKRDVARIRLEAVVGHQAARAWLHVFEPDSGAVLGAFELVPAEHDGAKRLRLSARVPSELVGDEATRQYGAVVARRRLRHIDPIALADLLYVTVVVKPLVTGDFARRVEQEFAAPAVKARFLRMAQASYRLSAEIENADLGDRETFVETRLAELGAMGRPAELATEATEAVTAGLFRYAVTAYNSLAEEVVQRLNLHRLRRLAGPDEAAAVETALSESMDLIVTVRQLRALLP
jgi:hypothetical protein